MPVNAARELPKGRGVYNVVGIGAGTTGFVTTAELPLRSQEIAPFATTDDGTNVSDLLVRWRRGVAFCAAPTSHLQLAHRIARCQSGGHGLRGRVFVPGEEVVIQQIVARELGPTLSHFRRGLSGASAVVENR
jgi:hypothetical protein